MKKTIKKIKKSIINKGGVVENNESPMYDYEQYQKSQSVILEQASKEYWTQHIDINRHQIMVGKTYLWVSAALLGAYFAVYRMIQDSLIGFSSTLFILVSGASVILAAGAFGMCLYALPGRKGYLRIGESWRVFEGNAYRALEKESQSIYSETLTELITKLDLAIEHGNKTNQARAIMLRRTSWLLISSFGAAVLACLIYIIETLTC